VAEHEDATVFLCLQCKGVLVPKESIAVFMKDAKEVVRIASVLPGDQTHVDTCFVPGCSGRFQAYRLHPDYALTVDICGCCGALWFDADELPHATRMHEALAAKKEIAKDFRFLHAVIMFFLGVPIEYYAKPRKRPIALYGLIAANIVVYILTIIMGQELDMLLMFDPDAPKNLSWFARLLTSGFDHADPVHLLGNMYFLYVFGDNIEDLLGAKKFLFFYLASVVFASFCHAALSDMPALGASGGVMAILGAYLVYCKRAKIALPYFFLWIWKKTRKVPALYVIGLYLVLDMIGVVLFDGRDGVGHWAHLGGALFGVVYAKITYEKVLRANPYLYYLNHMEE
jgi:membrane associated rhomboid family serine protease